MERKEKISTGILLVGMSLSVCLLVQSNQAYKKELKEMTELVKDQPNETKETEEQPTTEIVYLTKDGKENEALEQATKELFTILYSYDSEVETIQTRSEKAKNYTTKEAHDSLFPEDATQGTVTVQTSSTLTESPEIYLMTREDEHIHALISVSFEFSVEGSETIGSSFLYKVAFQPTTKKFVSITNLGTIPMN